MKQKQTLLLFITLSVVVSFLNGCGGGSTSSTPIDPGPGPNEWTVMVFMNADNDLEQFSIDNINQMQKIGSTGRIKIVVQWDRIPRQSDADGNWTGTRRYEITKGGKTLLADLRELNMGDPVVAKDFISWTQQNYPANHYCFIIWNHGNGWRAVKPEESPITKSISFDETSGEELSTRDLPGIISSAPTKIDVVAMDACLMQMLEVAYEIRDTAGYLVASEGSQIGYGYAYDSWLSPLASNPTMSPATLGKTIAQKYVRAYSNQQDIVQSVVDLSKVGDVATALDNYAGTLIPFTTLAASQLEAARGRALCYTRNTPDDSHYYDLQDYALTVNQSVYSTSLSEAYTQLAAAITGAVVYVGYGGSDMANSHGLSIWVPNPTDYNQSASEYVGLKLSRDTRWDEFLDAQRL